MIADMTPEQQLMYMSPSDGVDPRTGKAVRKFSTLAEYIEFKKQITHGK